MRIELDGLWIRGVSVGGLETCLEVPSWKIAFDLGRCTPSTVGCHTVLFSHAHADHMGAVASHVARRALRRAAPPRYVIPRENEQAFGDLMDAWRRLDLAELPCVVSPAGPGDELELHRQLVAEVFRAPHRAPCQGYHIFSEGRELLPELVGLPEQEIADRRRGGETVTRAVRRSELAFCGDTRFDVLERVPSLGQARRLMLECTFFDERVSVQAAREMGHVHLDEIADRAELLRGVGSLLLTHVSARYGRGEARELAARRLPGWLMERTQVFAE
jgi:ribonuclease Z